MKVKQGDLVRTPEGYYGIVMDMERRTVFQGNGLEKFMDFGEWNSLTVMPMNIFHSETSSVSNFSELCRDREALQRVVASGFKFGDQDEIAPTTAGDSTARERSKDCV